MPYSYINGMIWQLHILYLCWTSTASYKHKAIIMPCPHRGKTGMRQVWHHARNAWHILVCSMPDNAAQRSVRDQFLMHVEFSTICCAVHNCRISCNTPGMSADAQCRTDQTGLHHTLGHAVLGCLNTKIKPIWSEKDWRALLCVWICAGIWCSCWHRTVHTEFCSVSHFACEADTALNKTLAHISVWPAHLSSLTLPFLS